MREIIKYAIFFATGILISFFYSQSFPAFSQSQVVSQVNSTTSQSSPPSNELWNGITIAVVSAVLGFLVSIAIESIKKGSTPKKQLSYTKIIKSGIIGKIEKDVENKVSILYDGKPAKNMFYALFDIENTGNQQIKNQEIRFEFTEGSEILDVFFEPQKILPEMDFEEINLPISVNNEKKYKIGMIKPKEKFGFRFIVQSSENKIATLDHHTKNEEDVSFVAREAKKVADDIDQIKSFLSLSLTFFVLLPLLQNLLSKNVFLHPFFRDLSELVVSIVGLIGFIFVILPRFGSFIQSVVNLVSGSLQKPVDIQAQNIAVVAFGDSKVDVDSVTVQ
jgi:hypothetical protein